MKKQFWLIFLLLVCGCSFVVRDIKDEKIRRYGITQKDTDELLQKTDNTPAESKRELFKVKQK